MTSAFGDDEKSSKTQWVVLMHVGGRNGFGHLSGIHGAHLGHIEYIATDSEHQTIHWVSKTNDDGSVTEFTDTKEPVTGQKRDGLHRLPQSCGALLQHRRKSARSIHGARQPKPGVALRP